uniref:Uncharacterized protein n=1 Tax=Manihot esculenta TaxID=3983 RepID=A0A2C9UAV7_MANES
MIENRPMIEQHLKTSICLKLSMLINLIFFLRPIFFLSLVLKSSRVSSLLLQ